RASPLMPRRPPGATLFPYTTLFRSQQVQSAAREATATAVAAETWPVLAGLQDQMKEAAEKAVEAAAAAYTKQAVRDALAKIDEARQAGEETLREKSVDLQRRAVETAPQPAKPPAEIDRAHLSSFEEQVDRKS